MTQQIDFSQAVRLGSMLKAQAFGALYRPPTDVRVPGDVLGLRRLPEATCAVGSGFDAVGLPLHADGIDIVEALAVFPVLSLVAQHPVRPVHAFVVNIVMDLNDTFRWTREQIAEWLGGVEAAARDRAVRQARELVG